ncbi:hypothetical protein TIFTF001_034184 [Ficus carica]|uniref:Uncharacterized protein n=1 Tax=Ficus carica TaxID=3494 RepID=A0AA88DZG5_FICCA|nr:hypothetical protein TIFTF001_034184 [Ficus carica]
MMVSKLPRVVPTCTRTGLVHGLSWTGLVALPIHGCVYTYVMLFVLVERKLTTYVYAVDPKIMDTDRAAAYAFHGMLPLITSPSTVSQLMSSEGDAAMPDRDPEVYNDMNMRRYLDYVTDWHAYPRESMGHYCRRFQDAMLPHILALGSPEMRALQLLRNGLPPEVRAFVQAPMVDALVEDHGLVPLDDIGIEEPPFHWGPLLPEDPIPAVPLKEIPPQEAEVGADADNMDPEDPPVINIEGDDKEYPPVINIESDDEEDVEDDIENFEDDPE